MAIDATFWVAVSFIIFFGGLISAIVDDLSKRNGDKYYGN